MAQNAGEPPDILIERGGHTTHCGYVGQDKAECSFRTLATSVKVQFKHIFERVLKIDPARHRVVIVKDAGTPQQVLKEEAQILFKEFQVKACAFMNAQIGIVFSWVNKGTNALVIDIGYKSTRIVPVIDLITQMDFLAVLPMAGRTLEKFIIGLLKKHGVKGEIIERHSEQLFPYLLKEYFYFDAESEHNFEREAIKARKIMLPKHLSLQDSCGRSIEISLPSPVLPPDLILENCNSYDHSFSKEINKHILKILEKFGIDHLRSLIEFDYTSWRVGRIIITGGASNILGLRSLLIRELLMEIGFKRPAGTETTSSSPLVDVEFRGVAFTIRSVPPEETPGSWVGASIAFSLSGANKVFVSRETYKANFDVTFALDHAMNAFS